MSRFVAVAAAIAGGAVLFFSRPIFLPQPAVAQEQTPVETGRALVAQHCGVCHTKPDLVAASFGPSLDKTLFSSAEPADIEKAIAEGAPDMPGFDLTLSAAQIQAIIAYMKQAQPVISKTSAPAPAPAGPAAAGDN